MATTWGPLPAPRLLSGEEPISGTDARLRDFWSWAYSDLRTNTTRPLLAEYPVARAVGAELRPRVEWDSCDVRTPDGLRLEVKSGAYLQAWEQSKLTAIAFGGLRARVWGPDGRGVDQTYNADGYVFAVQTATEHASYDALELGQWSFWVLPRSVVVGTGQSSLGLARVQELAGPPVSYAGLSDRIRTIVVRTA
ncbi:hypothetical protein SAMN05660690_2482 [Geodermatophilus telluris]|uniref:Uncharacterized protein n=1 Tax=Geodermatophilus telluris TaxID=1190417 RepID=A0A1G6PAS2_9ACTN|nr:hypothetical protein [Geodermatophilus telluris]SDC77108.1 hypothetical protein SAMN05660690_2482 [Geodermatophilus telluris]